MPDLKEVVPPNIDSPDPRAELDELRHRERQIMALIGCESRDRLFHDLRNVLNELQLLRLLNESTNKQA